MAAALKNLLKWNNRSFDLQDSCDWLDLFDDFGPQLLRFLLSSEYDIDDIPEDDPSVLELKREMKDFPLADFKPKRNTAWILFALKKDLVNLPSPFRKDGILLPFEWRTGEEITQHSSLLPQGLIELADKVKTQFGAKAEEYYLYPDSVFNDRVDFGIGGAVFSSGWGALASGLYLALNPKAMLLEWPFSSIQYDFEKGEMDAVGHLEEKITLAASFNAAELAVAPCQYKEAVKTLNIAKAKYPENKKIQKMKIFMVKSAGNIEKTAENIVKCNQHNKQRLIRNICFAHAAVLLILAVAAGIVYWDHHHRTYVEYYADYVDKRGMPTGIFPLSERDLPERHAHYRFIYQGRKTFMGERVLREVMRSNSKGYYLEADEITQKFIDRPIRQQIDYGENFSLVHIKVVDRNGRVLEQRNYSGKNMTCIDFKRVDTATGRENGKMQTASGLGFSSNNPLQSKAEIKRWLLKRDKNGFLTEIRFCKNDSDIPGKNSEGVYGWSYDLDQYGRAIRAYYLGQNGKKMQLKNGIASIRYDYQKAAAGLLGVAWLNISDKPVKEYKFVLDANQNFSERSFYLNGKPGYEDGYFKVKYHFHQGHCVEAACFGIDGKPCLNKDGYAKITCKYDDRGNCIEWAYFGIDGKICFNKNGFAKGVCGYDEFGNCMLWACFDADGKPCLSKKGFAKVICIYDKLGNRIIDVYFGPDGKLCRNNDGYAKGNKKYDGWGNCIEETYFDTDGKLSLNNDGFAKVVSKYNEHGNRIEWEFFGPDGKRCWHKNGFAKVTRKFDKRGRLIRAAFFGTDGKACCHNNGFAKVTCKYDDRRKLIETSYFGTDGRPCVSKNGFAKVTCKYDKWGRRIEEVFFGVDGKPLLNKIGYAKGVCKYNERGDLIEAAFFGIDGKLCLHNDGYAKITHQYDERGNLIETACFDTDGKPCLYKGGYAKITRQYDERGNFIEEAYFGIDGKPCLSKDRVAKFTCKYDERGNLVEAACFGTDGKPCMHKDGYSKVTNKYDERGICVEKNVWDAKGHILLPRKIMVLAAEVFIGSQAEKQGIRQGDLFLNYAGQDWTNWFNSQIVLATKDKEKRIIFARKNPDGSFHIFSRIFSAGEIGVRRTVFWIDGKDHKKMMEAYNKFRSQKKM